MVACVINMGLSKSTLSPVNDVEIENSNVLTLENFKTCLVDGTSSKHDQIDSSFYSFVMTHEMSLLQDPRNYYLPSRPLMDACTSKDGKTWVATTLGNSNGIVSVLCFSHPEKYSKVILECCFNTQVTALELEKESCFNNSGKLELLVGCADGSVYGLEEVYLESHVSDTASLFLVSTNSHTSTKNGATSDFSGNSIAETSWYDPKDGLGEKVDTNEPSRNSVQHRTADAKQLSTWRIIKFLSSDAMRFIGANSKNETTTNIESLSVQSSDNKAAVPVLSSNLMQPRHAISSTVRFLMQYFYAGARVYSQALSTNIKDDVNNVQSVTIPNGIYIKKVVDPAEVLCPNFATRSDEFSFCRLLVDRDEKKELLLSKTFAVGNLTATHNLPQHSVSVLRFSSKKNFLVGRADGTILEFNKHCGPVTDEDMDIFDSVEEQELISQVPCQKYTVKPPVRLKTVGIESAIESVDSSTIASLSERNCEDFSFETNDAINYSQVKQYPYCDRNNELLHACSENLKWKPNAFKTQQNRENSGKTPRAHFVGDGEYETCFQTNNSMKKIQGKSVRISRVIANKNPVSKWFVSSIPQKKRPLLPALMDIKFSPNSNYVAFFFSSGYIKIFTYPNPRLYCVVHTFFGPPLCSAWTCDSKLLLIGGEDDFVTVINVKDRFLVGRCEGHRTWIRGLFVPKHLENNEFSFQVLGERSPQDLPTQKKFPDKHQDNEQLQFDSPHLILQSTVESKGGLCEIASPSRVLLDRGEYKSNPVLYSFASISEDGYFCLWELLEEEVCKKATGLANRYKCCNSIASSFKKAEDIEESWYGDQEKPEISLFSSMDDRTFFNRNLREKVVQSGTSEAECISQLADLKAFRKHHVPCDPTEEDNCHAKSVGCEKDIPTLSKRGPKKLLRKFDNGGLEDCVCIFSEDYLNCHIFRPQSFRRLTDEPIQLICSLDHCSYFEHPTTSNEESTRNSPLLISLSHSKKIQYWKKIHLNRN